MKQVRKALALLMALCLAFSLSTAAFASGEASGEASGSGEVEVDTTPLDTLVVDGVEVPYEEGDAIPEGGVLVTTERYSVGSYSKAYRAALYIDADGVNEDRSVTAAIVDGVYDGEGLTGGSITSENENFNGVIVADGAYTITGTAFSLTGNGGSDFQGFGAAIFAAGEAEVTIDSVTIDNSGVVRTSLVLADSAKVLVKNSSFATHDGVPAEGYVGTSDTSKMVSVPWVLGLDGNARGTNLLTNGTATYYNSTVMAEKWGVLSFDGCSTSANLIFINSTAAITGGLAVDLEEGPTGEQVEGFDFYEDDYKDNVITTSDGQPSGYGTLIIGDMLGVFAGSTIYTPTYACILANEGPTVVYTSSAAENLTGIVETLEGVNSAFVKDNEGYEIYALAEVLAEESYEEQNTVVYSERIGIMAYDDMRAASYDSAATIVINDGTEFYTGGTTMLIKGFPVNIYVDDATLVSGSGVILQVADCDDPGQGTDERVSGNVFNVSYEELTANNEDTRERTRTLEEMNDLTVSTSKSAGDHLVTATFSNMEELTGDMYNSSGSNTAYNSNAAILNMYVILDNIGVYSGAVSSSHGYHSEYTYTYVNDEGQEIGVIASPDWWDEYADEDWFAENGWDETDVSWHYLLSSFTDVACASADNGVIVELKNGTAWTVTGESYLTMLIVGEDCAVTGVMTVDGVETKIIPGTTYEGDIVILPA